MKTTLATLFTLLLFLSGTNAHAERYWGLGAGSSSFDLKPLSLETLDDGNAVRFIMGDTNSGFELDVSFTEYDWSTVPESSHDTFNLIFQA